MEVELPCWHILGIVSFLVRKCDAYLDDLEQVYITPHRLVMIVGGCLEGTYWSCHNSRKFSVLKQRSVTGNHAVGQRWWIPLLHRDIVQSDHVCYASPSRGLGPILHVFETCSLLLHRQAVWRRETENDLWTMKAVVKRRSTRECTRTTAYVMEVLFPIWLLIALETLLSLTLPHAHRSFFPTSSM